MSVRFCFIVACVSMAAGCGEKPAAEVRHPIGDSLSIDPEEAIVINRDAAVTSPVGAYMERLRTRTSIAEIGSLDGSPETIFASVVDALFFTDSSIAVLDQQSARVSVFSLDGDHLYSVGGQGGGPGEFEFPVALRAPAGDELWVVDGARMVHRFRLRAGELVFQDRLDTEGFARDACTADECVVMHVPSHDPGAA